MIKVFLVEDEYAIREGIKKSVDWAGNGFELVGEAGDGEVALPKILKEKPDILITDIRMPFMDGLELSRLIKKELPQIKIIILSGYDDFNYAKEAISIGVEEYILKPVSGESLMAELKKLAEAITAEQQETQVRLKYLKDREEIRLLEKQKFLHDIIDGKLSIRDSLTTGRELEIDITAAYYSVVLMQSVPVNIGDSDIDEYSGTKEEIYIKVKEMYEGRGNVYLYEQVGDVLCFLEKEDELQDLEKNIKGGIDDIITLMSDYPDMMYFISVGKPVERIRDVNLSYREASRRFAERYMLNESHIFYAGDGKASENSEYSEKFRDYSSSEQGIGKADAIDIESLDVSMISKKTIFNFMKQGTLSEVDDFVDEYYSRLGAKSVESVMMRQYILMEALLGALSLFENIGVSKNEATEILGDRSDPIKYNGSVEESKKYLKDLLHLMIEYRNKLSDKRYSDIINKAKTYIEEQYKNEDMSLQSVSSHVNVSSNHFSAIFRKETGVTFIDYLTTVRMDNAKDLLVSTSMKTSEIGFEVGYRDPHYFSYIFKKTQGMSPKEFRKEKKQ